MPKPSRKGAPPKPPAPPPDPPHRPYTPDEPVKRDADRLKPKGRRRTA